MASKVLLTSLLSLWLVYQDGGKATALLCKERKTVPITKEQLRDNSPWYLTAYIGSQPDEKHEFCVKSVYSYDPQSDMFNNTRTGVQEGTNTPKTRVLDIYASTSGVYDMVPRNEPGAFVISPYLEFTPGESFVSAHCEIHDGKPYTDRITAAFKTRNVSAEQIRKKLESVGVTDFSNLWIVPQAGCSN